MRWEDGRKGPGQPAPVGVTNAVACGAGRDGLRDDLT